MDYWFRRREENWGFTPVSWQGWTVLIGLGVLLIGGAIAATVVPGNLVELLLVVWIVVLVYIAWRIAAAKAPPKEQKR